MMITGNTLFAFVDAQDPFMPSPIAEEEHVGPVLSLMESRSFSFVFLFHTQRTRKNAQDTAHVIAERHDGCQVALHALPDSDRKDVSSLAVGVPLRHYRAGMAGNPHDIEGVCTALPKAGQGSMPKRVDYCILGQSKQFPNLIGVQFFGGANGRPSHGLDRTVAGISLPCLPSAARWK